jgi:hypothetical protein
MVASSYFIANDYDLAFNLNKLFHDYVALYTKLHYPENKRAISNTERRELNLKLQEAVNKITLLAMKMKQFKSDAELVEYPNYQTISSAKRSNRITMRI